MIEKENIVSTVDVVVNCAKSDTAKSLFQEYFPVEMELYTTATMKPFHLYNGKAEYRIL